MSSLVRAERYGVVFRLPTPHSLLLKLRPEFWQLGGSIGRGEGRVPSFLRALRGNGISECYMMRSLDALHRIACSHICANGLDKAGLISTRSSTRTFSA